MKMKSMANLDIEGRSIQLFPGDSVSKWGVINHSTVEGIIVYITAVRKGTWSHAGYNEGQEYFIPWSKLTFTFAEAPE